MKNKIITVEYETFHTDQIIEKLPKYNIKLVKKRYEWQTILILKGEYNNIRKLYQESYEDHGDLFEEWVEDNKVT